RALVQTQNVDRELDEELAFHLDMETEKRARSGMNPDEAKREARLAFGAVARSRAETREARWLSWFPDLSLDFKLGGRMLLRYPGLTLVGGLAMAFGIWVGVVTFEMVTMLFNPTLNLPDAQRLVQLRNYDVQDQTQELRAVNDFIVWQGALRSVTDLSAYRDLSRNLVVTAGDARPVVMAEITASAFRIAPERPLLGRTLGEADERTGVPEVAVIGYELWRTRFNSDSSVVGKTVQVGETYATVVGVMPKGYAFPVSHELWMPLRLDGLDREPLSGPAINIFGKLAPGVSLQDAETELAALGLRRAAELPVTHKNLRPQIAGYAKGFGSSLNASNGLMWFIIPTFGVMLVVLVCGNVALLFFARAATRESELIVRSALGATRKRIVMQLFAEALVLGTLAATVGLALGDFALRRWGTVFLMENMGRLPFWYNPHLSFTTVLYAVGLTLLAGVIAGVLPALKVTKGIGSCLRHAGSGGGGLKFGGVWTTIIVTQVAFTTAFPAMVFIENMLLVRLKTFDAGFPAKQYLSVFIEGPAPLADLNRNDPKTLAARKADADRFLPALQTLQQRIASDPGVLGVTFVDRLPTDVHREFSIDVDDATASSTPSAVASGTSAEPATKSENGERGPLRQVQVAYVDGAYFETLDAPMLAGRAFQPADFVPEPTVAIVDQGFVDQVLQGRNPIGRRISRIDWQAKERGTPNPYPWLHIVGVVKELGMGAPTQRGRAAGVYQPTVPGNMGPTYMVVHTRGDPLSLVPRLRALANAVDPTMRLSNFRRVDEVTNGILWVLQIWLKLTVLLTAIALLLSLAGIYAVMSFTVSRRTREIGIRVALGANARRVVAAIFRRPVIQVTAGVAAGAALAGVFLVFLTSCRDGICDDMGGVVTPARAAMLLLYAALVLGVCLMACVVPTRRALAVQPVEALRAE
ncbi:MAG: ABC transporter permease, partial [Gemmatimonas sp.]